MLVLLHDFSSDIPIFQNYIGASEIGPRLIIKKEIKTVVNKAQEHFQEQLLSSVIVKYRDSSVSRRRIIFLCLRLRQIIDLLATNKS